MSLKVQVNTNRNIQTSVDTSTTNINTRLKKIDFSLVKLEELLNVAEEVNGLEDGYTLVYDAEEERWITQAVEGINNIDGGTF
jgi:exonuclease VII large subunit